MILATSYNLQIVTDYSRSETFKITVG